jgi:hypothetical protein
MAERNAEEHQFCSFCESLLFEASADGLCVWCRAGFPPSYAAWIMRATQEPQRFTSA